MHNENWDDLRYVLGVVETGSVLQAAKRLGVNHATVLRHVAAFEDRHGIPIFERTAQGYQLLPDRIHVIRAAQDAEYAMQEVARLAKGGRQTITGTVRVASTDSLCMMVLPQFVSALAKSDANIEVSLLSSNMHLDLLLEKSLIVVRPSARLADDLIGDAVAELGLAAYATSRIADKWYNLNGPLARSIGGKWLAEEIPPDKIISGADSFLTLKEMAVLGDGIAILPCMLADQDRRLVRLDDAMPHLQVPVWVARHVETTETEQLMLVRRELSAFLASKADMLMGKAG